MALRPFFNSSTYQLLLSGGGSGKQRYHRRFFPTVSEREPRRAASVTSSFADALCTPRMTIPAQRGHASAYFPLGLSHDPPRQHSCGRDCRRASPPFPSSLPRYPQGGCEGTAGASCPFACSNPAVRFKKWPFCFRGILRWR